MFGLSPTVTHLTFTPQVPRALFDIMLQIWHVLKHCLILFSCSMHNNSSLPSVPLMPPLKPTVPHCSTLLHDSCALFCPLGFHLHTTSIYFPFRLVGYRSCHVFLIGNEYEKCLAKYISDNRHALSIPSTNFGNCLVFFFFCVIFVTLETAHSLVGHEKCWCQAVGFAMGAQQLDAL